MITMFENYCLDFIMTFDNIYFYMVFIKVVFD